MDNFFASPQLLRHLGLKQIAVTGIIRANQVENEPFQDLVKIAKESRERSDVTTDVSSNKTAVRWKDKKFVNALSTLTGKEPIQSVKRFCKKQNKRVDIEQPNILNRYNKSMGIVNRMDQNIAAYMINLQSKKWWWPLIDLCWIILSIMFSKYSA